MQQTQSTAMRDGPVVAGTRAARQATPSGQVRYVLKR